jgi:hypothetical protein
MDDVVARLGVPRPRRCPRRLDKIATQQSPVDPALRRVRRQARPAHQSGKGVLGSRIGDVIGTSLRATSWPAPGRLSTGHRDEDLSTDSWCGQWFEETAHLLSSARFPPARS